jgi:hypothetical protein
LTIPTNIILPLPNTDDLNVYLRELNFSLQTMYEQLAQGINGDIRADYAKGRELWTPVLKGSTVAGTFTYNHQAGWVLRQGIINDVWFDVSWSAAGTAAGNLYVELPYKVALSNQKPFVGIVQSSVLAYTGGTGIVINGISNTYRGEFWNVGSGFTTANQAVTASGQLIGHLRYIGQGDERA